MNLNRNPNLDDLRSLIATADDRAGHHVLWVDDQAEVHLTKLKRYPIPEFPDNGQRVKLRVQTFPCAKEYVGPQTAGDNEWMNLLYDGLVKKWYKLNGTPGYLEIEQIAHPEDFDENGVMKPWR